MTWPLYFSQSLSLGSPESGVGLCLLWTPQERVLPALDPGSYALAGNLYLHSAHIYAHDWDRAEELVAHHYRHGDPRLARDARGSFVAALEPPEIVVRHYSRGASTSRPSAAPTPAGWACSSRPTWAR